MARKLSKPEPAPQRALVDVCVHGQPISAQTGRRDLLNGWKRQVGAACNAVWQRPPLQGILYVNDRQVMDGEGRRRDINEPLKVRYMSEALALAVSDGRPFVHIELWHKPDKERVS